jgi:hypothetical protein
MRSTLLCLCAAFLSLAGCSSPSTVELPVGDLYGSAQLYLNENDIASDHSGVRVTVEGSSISSITNARGEWMLPALPSRTYNIKLEKDSFGTCVIHSYAHLGGEPSRKSPVKLYKIPSCEPIFDAIQHIPGQVTLFTHVNCILGPTNRIAIFFSNAPDVSSDLDKHVVSMIGAAGGAGDPQPTYLDQYWLQKGGFLERSGLKLYDSVYAVVYSLGAHDYTTDPVTQRLIYPSIYPVPSRTLAFKMAQ